ncbi:four helix bundle protein [Bacteroidota bacterium]
MSKIKSFKDLEVYKLAHKLAMDIFVITKEFPTEEKYSLTDQIRRSSRSVSVNITEGWGKRVYENLFKKHLIDANGSLDETKEWLEYAHDCNYIDDITYEDLYNRSLELGAKLYKLHENWVTYKK